LRDKDICKVLKIQCLHIQFGHPIWAKQKVTPKTSNEHNTSQKKGKMKLKIPFFGSVMNFTSRLLINSVCECERFSMIKPCVCEGGESKQE
jgi:hypothetical protein